MQEQFLNKKEFYEKVLQIIKIDSFVSQDYLWFI